MAGVDAVRGSERDERPKWSLTLRLPALCFLLVVGAGALFWGFLAQYEPLAEGAMAGVTATGSRYVETLGEPDDLILLDHREGDTFFAAFTIRNDGPLPITIERLLEPYQMNDPNVKGEFYPTQVLVHPGEPFVGAKNIEYDSWEGFTPFSLSAGEERRVAVRYEFGECRLSRGEWVSIGGYAARFSVFGLDRNTFYALRTPLG